MMSWTDVWDWSLSEPPVGLPKSMWPGIRDRGLPTLKMPGKMWCYSVGDRWWIVMMVAHATDPTMLSMPRRELIETPAVIGWPAGWSDAMIEYWTAYPSSASEQEKIMLADHLPWF